MPVAADSLKKKRDAAEPVAVVGMACRLPGDVHSPSDFWNLLAAGQNAVGEVPSGRWGHYREYGPEFEAAQRRAIKYGHFLTDIERFDAEFFGISPREAALMDPQQRILLEVAWEALEHAGIPAHRLAGTDAGVFVGVATGDYGAQTLEDLPGIEPWTGIGAATCAVANRISHVLDLRGPSIAVDTACSASLVALHLACQSLRLGESSLAFAAGVNLLVSPGQTLTLDAAGTLAPDGRSKAFSASADGYGRGEGCGVVVLKRLSDAENDGDRVLAVVRGSAVGQDGRTNGIMAPCGQAQEYVVRRACTQAGVDPGTVDYVEAHGTGTTLGDPLEASALSAVYGAGRPVDQPCVIGSVKANIGHLEGAAGIAGVIKAVLVLHHAEIPATLLDGERNPGIDWQASGLDLATEHMAWPRWGYPRRVGVSAFGYGGTDAHIVLEQAPDAKRTAVPEDPADTGEHRLFPLSAASDEALAALADKFADAIADGKDRPLAAIGRTLATRRSPLPHRAVVAAMDRAELVTRLRALAASEPDPCVITGTAAADPGSVWVFSGHGSQWPGMGRELLGDARFAAVIDELDPIFQAEIGFSPRQVLLDGDFEDVAKAQTMIFAMQVGLAELWRSHGVTPKAVIGHSVGEIAASVVCGALSLADGARLICRRSLLLRKVAGQGAMAMVTLPFAEVEQRLGGLTDVVAAIFSSPTSTVVSGPPKAVDEVVRQWSDEGVAVRRVVSDVAFHSPQMDILLADLVAAAAEFVPQDARIPMYTTALRDPRATFVADGDYWAANLRNPVRLAAAVEAAAADGYLNFLEISPHPVVAHSISETLAECGIDDTFVGTTLRRDRPAGLMFRTSVAAVHCRGICVDWASLYPGGDLVDLPVTQWQGRRHWHNLSALTRNQGRGHDVDSHTLLGAPLSIAGSELRVWRTTLDDGNRPYPGSHALDGVEIVPAAVLVETFAQAAVGDDGTAGLADIDMRHPLMTADRREVQVVRDGTRLCLAARAPVEAAAEEAPWLIVAQAAIPAEPVVLPPVLADGNAHRLFPTDPTLVKQRLAEVGVPETGFDWTVEELDYGLGMVRARVSVNGPGRNWAPVFDAVMSIAPAAFAGAPLLRMVVHINEMIRIGEPPRTVGIEISLDHEREDTVNATVATTDGLVVARLYGLRYPVIEHVPRPERGDDAAAVATGQDRDALADVPFEQLHERVFEMVRSQIAAEMKLPEASLHPRRPLVEQGLDSVMTTVIRHRLEKRFACSLRPTVFWQLPTVVAMTDYLVELLTMQADEREATAQAGQPAAAVGSGEVRVVAAPDHDREGA